MKKKVFFFSLLFSINLFGQPSDLGKVPPRVYPRYPEMEDRFLSLDVGLLYQQMRIENTDICYVHIGDGGGTKEDPSTKRLVKELDFSMFPGVRAGLGYDFGRRTFRFKADFEWLYSRGKFNDTVTGAQDIVPTYIVYAFGPNSDVFVPLYQQVRSWMKSNYYLLDCYFAKGIYLSEMVSFEPFAGIKAAWQDFDHYRKFFDATNEALLSADQAWLERGATNTWGVGPMIGAHGNVYIGQDWGLYSMFNFAALLGEASANTYFGIVTSEDYPGDKYETVHQNSLTPTLRATFGIQYGQVCLENTSYVFFRIGFDSRVYFNRFLKVNHLGKEVLSSTSERIVEGPQGLNGDAGMTGLVLELACAF